MKQAQKVAFYKPLAITALVGLLAFSTTDILAQRGGYDNRPDPRQPGPENRQPVRRVQPGAPVRGQRYAAIGGPSVQVSFGGVPYHYANGYYYRPFGNYYRVVAPPRGLRIQVLPAGFLSLRVGVNPFFYFDGVFYRQAVVTNPAGAQENNYEVVDAPVGAQVPNLPEGARQVMINNNKYYELDGTYYSEYVNDNGELWYEVAGKNGQLNTPEAAAAPAPQVGDKYEQLPESCKVVVLSGRKYYVSATNTYYQEIIENNKIYYQIVGIAGDIQQ